MADKIRAERGQSEGERKMVTALFTDIAGSTALAESMDPEDWREIVTGAHRRVSEAVYRYEGTIAQLLGDGVLAFFGAPIAHEDDPERAIRAALDILASIRQYAETLKRERGLPAFQMRVGLNTGLVVVGNIGNDLHMEYLAVGDTINLAARMQSAADPDSAFVTQNTQRLAATLFDYEDRGRLDVKGKVEPVQTYRVLGERKDATRARGIAGLSSPLVGRDNQLGSLLQLVDGVRAGRGAVVSIIGEAGLGKSRLTAEWRKQSRAGEPPLRWVEGRCLSFTASVAHHLSTDVLRALCGLPADASEDAVDTGLRRCLGELNGVDIDDIYPYLAHLLGAKMDETAEARVKYLDGPALLTRHTVAYSALISAMTQAMPTVIVCEDVHWADPSSVELLSRVVPIAAEVPVLFAFVTRPDRDAPGWKLIANAHETAGVGALEIKLAPLSEADSQQLVSNLLEVEALPDSVRKLILEKAEGNPFFVEEVIRMLIDRGGIVRSPSSGNWIVTSDIQKIDIPDTLHGVLSARIDRLPEEIKHVLQVAAVIGRRFQVKVLERVLEAEAGA
jgi:class 3 adenylate cyclase